MEVAGIPRKKILRWLTPHYIIALGIIALLAIVAYLTIQSAIATEKTSAALINISGRQRMLSQKAALLSVQLVFGIRDEDQTAIRDELSLTIRSLEEAHRGLCEGSTALGLPGVLSSEVYQMIYNDPVNLGAKLQKYTGEVRVLLDLPQDKLIGNREQLDRITGLSADLLAALEVVVNQFQRESETRMLKLQTMQALFLGATLLVLFLEALFIFRPAVKTIRREAEALSLANSELSQMSNADGLTGIANRRLFDGTWRLEWERALREREPMAVIMADIDFFKAYNDTYGHQAGDDCLRRVAKALQSAVKRGTDFVGRYGGEEFAIILPNTDPQGAQRVAESLRLAVEQMGIEHVHGVAGAVTVSLGVATATPNKYMARRQLIALADQALYLAKQNGRNRVELLQHGNVHSSQSTEADSEQGLFPFRM